MNAIYTAGLIPSHSTDGHYDVSPDGADEGGRVRTLSGYDRKMKRLGFHRNIKREKDIDGAVYGQDGGVIRVWVNVDGDEFREVVYV